MQHALGRLVPCALMQTIVKLAGETTKSFAPCFSTAQRILSS